MDNMNIKEQTMQFYDQIVEQTFKVQKIEFRKMNNHYHLPIETPEGNLSREMKQLNGLYTQRFNQRHRRVGHLLQRRYKAILVEKDNYLLALCRYVVLNPVRTKIVKDPKDWK